MSTHTTPLFDRKVLLALVPLASLAASHPHEGNPNAHGPVDFSEIAQSIAAATISTQPASAIETSSSSHTTHLTPSLLHGIIPNVTTSTGRGTSTDTDPLVIIPVTNTVTDLVNYDTYTIPASLPPIPPPSASTSTTTTSGADRTRTQTVWATVVKQTQVVTVVKTLTPTHKLTSSQAWPKGYCTGKGEVAVNGKCVPTTLTTSVISTGTQHGQGQSTPSSTSSSVSFTITSPTSTSTSTTSTSTTRSTTTSTSTDTDPLIIIPVTGTVTDLINYDTYTIPASLPPLPPPPPRASGSSSKSSSSTSDDGPLEIIPVTGTVTDLVDYETVMVPSATATTVVVIPVSSGSGSSSKSQGMGQMLGHIQGMGQSSRVVVHPTMSVGDRLTVVTGIDRRTTITRASPSNASATGGEYCKEEE